MSEYPSEMPEEPKGVGSIIRVVFEGPVEYDPDASGADDFYVEVGPGRWVEYGSDGADEFTWGQMLQIIEYGESEVFEVVYEGFGATEREDAFGHHVKDFIWREGL